MYTAQGHPLELYRLGALDELPKQTSRKATKAKDWASKQSRRAVTRGGLREKKRVSMSILNISGYRGQ